ncbi:MAG: AarF/ABC1/UbiB kinase family protein [Planctomycetes bacterium]|nr:AarF/ABC1/UbiB kinase family protein [Planctomycetota bacterium]
MAIRKIGIASRTYRHVNRYRQILTVLMRYGFDDLVDRLRIGQYLEIGLQLITRNRREQVESLTTAERLRMVFEELGPTFIKLGQVLSTRPDLIPPAFADELAKLQQQVPAFPFEKAREIIESDLGRPIAEVFEHIEEEAIAAGSIGQVHKATLRGGEQVVIKVQRPNIQRTIEIDLEILLHLAMLVEKHLEGWKAYRPSRIVDEFSRIIEMELDFTVEASHLERFAGQFHDDPTIYVPKVYREWTSQRVITLEYLDVVPVTDVDALVSNGYNPNRIAERGTQLMLKQIFVHGFFHADPHPGNIFVLPGDVICLLDFGMMGRIDRQRREGFADLIFALGVRDPVRATTALLRVTEQDDEADVDLRHLETDVAGFIDLHVAAEIADLDFGKMLHGLLGLVARHHLLIPAEMVAMLKAASTVERLAAELDPKLNMIAAARPYVRRLRLDRIRPTRVLREMMESGGDLVQFVREIPNGVRDVLNLAKRGGLKINFQHRGLDKLMEVNERIANRVSFAIVVGALIMGSSLIVHSKIPPYWHGIPIIGLVGYIGAGVLGMLLLVAIIRHGRL